MTAQELIKKYDLHDSCITNISYTRESKKLEITLDFCQWAQSWYKDDMPENIPIKLILYSIDKYDGIIGEIDYYSILNVEIKDDNKLSFYILDDFHNKNYKYILSPSDIEINIMDETN